MKSKSYTKLCPECGKELIYTNQISFKRSLKHNLKCRSCCKKIFKIKDVFIEEHQKGLTDTQLAELFGSNTIAVAQNRKRYGLKPNHDRRKLTTSLDENNIKCSICGIVSDKAKFTLGKAGKKNSYRYSYCNKCLYEKRKETIKTKDNIDKYLCRRHIAIKASAKVRGIDFQLSIKDLKELYKEQDSKCFYTDIQLYCSHGNGVHPNSMSIDRLNNSKGYCKSNVVLCCRRINTAKSDFTLDEIKEYMPGWYERIIKKLDFDVVK